MKTIILNILRCCTHLKGGNVCLFNNFEMILENILQILFLPKISHNASQSPNLNPSMLYLQMTDKKHYNYCHRTRPDYISYTLLWRGLLNHPMRIWLTDPSRSSSSAWLPLKSDIYNYYWDCCSVPPTSSSFLLPVGLVAKPCPSDVSLLSNETQLALGLVRSLSHQIW